jgi:hypothetical protein
VKTTKAYRHDVMSYPDLTIATKIALDLCADIEELLGLLREKYDEDDPCISGKCWYCRVRKALEGQ